MKGIQAAPVRPCDREHDRSAPRREQVSHAARPRAGARWDDARMATNKLPPLAALRLFEAAGRHRSFTAAAEELGRTPSAVSHAVRVLEDRLGLPLFHRDPRGLRLTPDGEELLAAASRALEGLGRTIERLTSARTTVGLNLSAPPTFASRWLLPRLPALKRRHPALALSISTEHNWVELGDGRWDLAVRMAPEPTGSGEWHHLAPQRLAPIAPPALAGVPIEAALKRLPAIHVTSVREDWAVWAARRGARAPDPARGLRFDTVHMAVEAAAQGLGVALAHLPVCADDIASGRVAMLEEPVESSTAYWLVARPGLLRQQDGRLLAAWLREEMAPGQRPAREAPRAPDGRPMTLQ
jgi:DNA-binding transcriptional LysR family regulator